MNLELDGHQVKISSPEKLLFPTAGVTKADMVDYYVRIAPVMLPHLAGRPISMQRFPNGIEKSGFYQKEAADYFPDWITTAAVEVKEEGVSQPQVVVDSAAALAYLANLGVITLHTWLSRVGHLEKPDKLIFDLDPPGDDFETARFAAHTLRGLLTDLDLPAFLMTTGSRGLHVVVPLEPNADFDTARQFARRLAELAARRAPERLTVEVRKDERQGRLFLDYLRNAYAQTAVAPYALRARPGAPVATPLRWDELDAPEMNSQRYTLGNIFRRLAHIEGLWQGFYEMRCNLAKAARALDAID